VRLPGRNAKPHSSRLTGLFGGGDAGGGYQMSGRTKRNAINQSVIWKLDGAGKRMNLAFAALNEDRDRNTSEVKT